MLHVKGDIIIPCSYVILHSHTALVCAMEFIYTLDQYTRANPWRRLLSHKMVVTKKLFIIITITTEQFCQAVSCAVNMSGVLWNTTSGREKGWRPGKCCTCIERTHIHNVMYIGHLQSSSIILCGGLCYYILTCHYSNATISHTPSVWRIIILYYIASGDA